MLSCDLGDGNPFRVESHTTGIGSGDSGIPVSLCDNKWHNISALYDDEQIALRVDQLPAVIAVAPQRTIGRIQTKSPLYIGGIPGLFHITSNSTNSL